jgi:hypothetical protein
MRWQGARFGGKLFQSFPQPYVDRCQSAACQAIAVLRSCLRIGLGCLTSANEAEVRPVYRGLDLVSLGERMGIENITPIEDQTVVDRTAQ